MSARSRFLTTADVARWLERSPRAVRWMAGVGLLVSERTQSGQHLFRRDDVARLAERRAEARYRGVKVLRPKRFGVPGQPEQLSFWWVGRPKPAKAPLRFVARPEIINGCGSTSRGIVPKSARG